MEREVLTTGIGGQGIQLATRVLAEGAVAAGLEVLLFGSYGGMMRGGRTDTTLVVGDAPIETPPVVPEAWAAMVMHHDHAGPAWSKLRADGVALVNSTVVETRPGHPAAVIEVPATDLAVDVGNIVAASMVLLGALAAATEIVPLGHLTAAVERALPPYRRGLVDLNVAALAAGHDAVTPSTHPAWAAAAAP